MKTIFIFLLLCLCGIGVQATRPDKSDKIAPRWKNGAFPKNHDNSYYFKVAHGEGRTLSDACESAVLTLVGDLASMHGVSVKGTAIEKIKAESRDHVYTENIEHSTSYTRHILHKSITILIAQFIQIIDVVFVRHKATSSVCLFLKQKHTGYTQFGKLNHQIVQRLVILTIQTFFRITFHDILGLLFMFTEQR